MRTSLILALFAAFIFFGSCRQNKTYRIGISQCSYDDWRDKMNNEVIRESMLHDDVEIEIRSADSDSKKQIEDLHYFRDNGFDVIVVAPNEAAPLTPVVEEIYRDGVPVIIFDRNINGDTFTQHIGVNNHNIGEKAAEYALNIVEPPLKVIEVYGLVNSTPAIERSKGFSNILADGHGEIVAGAPADWMQDKAEIVVDSMLKLHPEANLIFAHNDRMAIGASIAASKLGRDGIKIIGIDAAPAIGIKAVADGVINATFLYPTEGGLILREAINIAKGGEFQRNKELKSASAVDASNADILLLQNEMLEDDTKKVIALKDQLDSFMSIHNAQTALVYAVIAILVLLFGVLFLVLRTFWAHRRHQNALLAQNRLLEEERDKQKELNQMLEEATQSKLAFFTNVSHDLRTPLTLISEPVAQLKHAPNLDSHQKTMVTIADKNVRILQRLINEILDFRKFENNKLKLKLTEVDFRQLIREWVESFYAVARKRSIRLTLDEPDRDINMNLALDPEKIERVFFNILSNAFKYSPDNSDITVSYKIDNEHLIIKVKDEGEGISREDMKHIFDRFFRAERVLPHGSGIGLSLAKAFVELHGGELSVESELKKGSEFTISLPVTHVAEEAETVDKTIREEDVEIEMEDVESEIAFDDSKPIVLVIDDNKDIRELVGELLKDDYNIITAPGGKEGIKKASRYVPDLVISDVMMPGMDGMETCRRLKAETVTSHIPVLMLTACSLDEQRVQGFDSGADGYVAKPFSGEVLKSQVASLIANRKRILELASAAPKTVKGKEKAPSHSTLSDKDIDNEFYHRFIEVFENRIGDPDLNVEALASEMGFERTQLYRKLKAITNYSPVELMRHLRLKRARVLLTSSDKTISEICYEVGFSNPAYFTKCYREAYGETPSETRSHLS